MDRRAGRKGSGEAYRGASGRQGGATDLGACAGVRGLVDTTAVQREEAAAAACEVPLVRVGLYAVGAAGRWCAIVGRRSLGRVRAEEA